MKLSVYCKENKENASIKNALLDSIKKERFEIDDNDPDIVLFVGGDGTFLRVVHQYIDKLDHICFIGINTGSLGFLVNFTLKDIPYIFSFLKENKFNIRKHSLIECLINEKETIYAVNEIRLENPFHTLICQIDINDEHLEDFRGNGLNISSELGSSAYNKSLGGSLIDHDLDILQLTEIAPISNNVYRPIGSPLVVSNNKAIKISGDIKECVIGYDHLLKTNDQLSSLKIFKSHKKINIICPEDYSYIQSIKRSFTK